MGAKVWLYILGILALINLILGVYFLTRDLKKTKKHWKRQNFIVDCSFLILFIMDLAVSVLVWINFQEQLQMFS